MANIYTVLPFELEKVKRVKENNLMLLKQNTSKFAHFTIYKFA